MGQLFSSSGDEEQFAELVRETKLGPSQLKAAYKGFKGVATKGAVSKQEVFSLLQRAGVKSKLLCSVFWNVIAKGGAAQESVSFEEFCGALSLAQRGSAKEKVELAFRLLDVDGDGFISKQELLDVVSAVFDMTGQLVSYSGRIFSTPSDLVTAFFDEFDVSKSGKVSREDYELGAYRSLDYVSTLALFGSVAPFQTIPESAPSAAGGGPVFGPQLPGGEVVMM